MRASGEIGRENMQEVRIVAGCLVLPQKCPRARVPENSITAPAAEEKGKHAQIPCSGHCCVYKQ